MDWLVFGDDYGAHPSTTQHLVNALPSDDRVLWVQSVGMRSPAWADVRQARTLWRRAARRRAPAATSQTAFSVGPTVHVVRLNVVPYHHASWANHVNSAWASRQLAEHIRRLGLEDLTLLSATPVAGVLTQGLPIARKAYLRLDDYAHLPGVDPRVIRRHEVPFIEDVDVVVHPAANLRPAFARSALHLPQGVDVDHFKPRRKRRPTRVLGFFGLLADWVDRDLIAQLAAACPRWTFEFIGRLPADAAAMPKAPNIVMRDAVPYAALPAATAHWQAAWVPFVVDELTAAVDPLKAREYLAAGLPVATTPLPAITHLSSVTVVEDSKEAQSWLMHLEQSCTEVLGKRAMASVATDTWAHRARTLRAAMTGGCVGR